MSCKHPLQAWRSRSGPDRVTGHWPLVFDIKKGIPKKEVLVPCGKCIACRLERSRQWAMRCMAEASMHDFNCFVTLTYNYENLERKLKIKSTVCPENYVYTLNKREFQLFIKRLRKELYKDENGRLKIRYFHCGEYGDRFERPHHHVCIFGYWPSDAKPWKSVSGSQLYTSDFLSGVWGNGYVVIGDVTWESAAYVARYVTKKIYGELADIWYEGRTPEYVSCSLRKAIGKGWYELYKGDLAGDSMMIRPGIFARPPKYFDKILELENPEDLKRRKEERTKKAIANLKGRKQRLHEERLMLHRFKPKSKRSYENE